MVRLALTGVFSALHREYDAHSDQKQLHGADEDVDDPGTPTAEADADDHIDAEHPGVLAVGSVRSVQQRGDNIQELGGKDPSD